MSATIDRCIVKEFSQLKCQFSKSGVILLIDINAVTGFMESRKNAFEFALVAVQGRSQKSNKCGDSALMKRCGRLLGESRPRANRSGDGEGWGLTGSRSSCVVDLLFSCFAYRRCFEAAAVSSAGRGSPIATQTLGSCCDCRLTNR